MKNILPILTAFAIVAVLVGGTMVNATAFAPTKAPVNYKHAMQAKGIPAEVHTKNVHANSLPELVAHGKAKHKEPLEPVEISYEEAEQNIGLDTNKAILYDSSGRHYAIMTYANGYFVADVYDTLAGDHPQEGSKWWGIYNGGQWTGFYDHPDSDPTVVFGAYDKVPGKPHMKNYFLWTFEFLGQDHTYYGLGILLN